MSIITKPKAIELPVRPLAEPDRWTAPRLLAEDAVLRAARAQRDAATAKALAAFFLHGVAWLAHKLVVEPLRRWLERERMIRELSMLSDRELADLGVTPGEIPYIAAGKPPGPGRFDAAETARRPLAVNENRRPHHPSRVA